MTIAIGSDHAGFSLKEEIKRYLSERAIPFLDVGTTNDQSCDYPDYAAAVSEKVANGECGQGVLVCGTGIGMAMVANKFPGVRAALVSSVYAAKMSKKHTNANVLCLSAWFTGSGLAREMIRVWIETEFEAGRHERRLKKVAEIESRLGGK